MSRRSHAGTLLVCAVVFLGLGFSTRPASPHEPISAERVARANSGAIPTDTVRASTTGPLPVVLSLPSRVSGIPVLEYHIVEAPALAGVAKRSFTWIPGGSAPGLYHARLEAVHPDAESDTLVVEIELSSE